MTTPDRQPATAATEKAAYRAVGCQEACVDCGCHERFDQLHESAQKLWRGFLLTCLGWACMTALVVIGWMR